MGERFIFEGLDRHFEKFQLSWGHSSKSSEVLALCSSIVTNFEKVIISQFLFDQSYNFFLKNIIGKTPGAMDSRANMRLMHIYAEAYVYHLNMIRVLLEALSKVDTEQKYTKFLNDILDFYKKRFSTLKDIRDTIQHLEDRILWKGKDGRKIDTGILSIANFFNSEYETTSSEGRQVRVDVLDYESVSQLHAFLQNLLKQV